MWNLTHGIVIIIIIVIIITVLLLLFKLIFFIFQEIVPVTSIKVKKTNSYTEKNDNSGKKKALKKERKKSEMGLKGRCLLIQMHFCRGYDYGGKVDFSKGCWNPKRKMWVTTHFSEIIKQP